MRNQCRKTAAVLIVSSAIAGCSSDSNSPAPSPPPPPPPPVMSPPPPTVGNPDSVYSRPFNTAANAPLAAIDPGTGQLHYGAYANRDQTNADHMIPDFSYAGYMGGGVALPDPSSIPVIVTLAPDGPADDLARINAAIAQVAAQTPDARGIRGTVLLQAGDWQVSDKIIISTDGIILRGEGQDAGGTVIQATTTDNRADFIEVRGQGGGRNVRADMDERRTSITQSYVPVGSNSVEVALTAGYSVGDSIGIRRTPNAEWLGPNGVDTAQYGWDTNTYAVVFERTVTAIDGDRLTFDIPIVDTIETQFGGGEVYRIDTSERLQQVGIENLRVETLSYADITREDRAWHAINFYETENSWVRDVTVRIFSRAFLFHDGTRHITAEDVAHIDPGVPVQSPNLYAFDNEGGSQILFQRCYADQSRHAFVTGSRVQGPNAYLDCLAENSSNDSGPHQRWATGVLYDNTKDWRWRVQNRATSGTGHGWAGAQNLLWNSEYVQIVNQAPPAAQNYIVGNIGDIIDGSFVPSEPNGIIETHGAPVMPRSLYLQQLEDRLGASAVEAVTLPQQRTGTIWNALAVWKGGGEFQP